MFARPFCAVLAIALFGCAPAPTPPQLADLIGDMLASTAELKVERKDGRKRTGSAVVIAADASSGKAQLLTAAHLLEPVVTQRIEVVTQLRQSVLPATLLAIDSAADLALIETVDPAVRPVSFAAEAALGAEVRVVAFPWGRRRTVVSGIVSQLVWDNPVSYASVPLTGPVGLIDAPVSYGMSGGGVFARRDGRLLGIVRGYRSARMRVPGKTDPFTLPVAGETTVVPTPAILCFLMARGYDHLLADTDRGLAAAARCGGQK